MSFTFGATGQQAGQGMTGFQFNPNQQSQQQQQQNKGFGFTAPQTGSTGFGAPAASTGFSFGAPAASTGFTFGTQNAALTPNTGFAAAATTAPSLFAPTATTTAAASSGFGFGTTATAPSTGFGFGAAGTTTAPAAPTAFGFGATPAAPNMTAPAATTNTGFSFGGTGGGMTFGQVAQAPAAPAATGFNFATPAAATTSQTTGFNFAAPPATTTTPVAFNLSQPAATSSASTGFGGFGMQPAATTTSFTGFGAPTTTTAASSFSMFGTPAAATTAATTGFSLGGVGASMPTLNFGPASSAPTATLGAAPANTVAPGFGTQPTLGGEFQMGGVAPSSTAAAPAAPFGGFNFSTPIKSTPDATATSTSQFQLPTAASTGLSFGINTASTVSNVATSAPAPLSFSLTPSSKTESTASSSLLLGKPMTSTAPLSGLASVIKTQTSSLPSTTTVSSTSSAPAFPFTSATSTTTATGFSFPASSSTSTTAATTTTAPSLFGMQTALSTASSVSSAITSAVLSTTTSVTSSISSISAINFRQLEDTINKWKIELEDQEKVFLNQATQVNAWDRLLISNGEKITVLNDAVEKVKLEQQRLDLELDFIFAQQSELDELLAPLEKSMESTPNINIQQHADLEREHTYHLAENIDAQLKRMSEDIREIIEHVNTANKAQNDNNPVHQIVKILNAHMDALHWVDQNTVDLQRRLEGVSKLYESQKRENEKTF